MIPRPRTALRRLPYSLSLLALVAGASRAGAQFIGWSEQPVYAPGTGFVPQLQYIATDVEAERDMYNYSGSPPLAVDRLYLSSGFGIGWNNYLYSPYLLTYSLALEPTYVWQAYGPPAQLSQSQLWELNGTAVANVLQDKPYATTLSYGESHEEVKYDFFNSATVDSQNWGAATGWREGAVPVDVNFQQSHQDSTSLNQENITDQTTVNVHAKNERGAGNLTDLIYQFGLFNLDTETPGGSYQSQNTYNNVTLTDLEHFQNSTLRSLVLFNQIDSPGASSSDLNATVSDNVQHTPHLAGNYGYTLSWYDGNDADSIQNTITAGLNHQLYDSLNSGLQFVGSALNSTSDGSELDSYSGQLNGSENYTKRLGHWGGLSLGENASYTMTEQDVTGTEAVIANESHTVPANGLVPLSQPRDLSVTSVTSGNITLQSGLDYTVIQTTDPWQIQIISSGPNHIQPGATILVTYTIESNPSGNYSTFADQAQITLSFWGDHADVFARFDFTDNQASSPEFLLLNDTQYQYGADFNWRRLGLHGDYTDDRSSLYDNRAWNLAENYSLPVSARSTLGLSLNQQWTTYSFANSASASGSSGSETESGSFYNYLLRYDWRPFGGLTWNAEIGYQQQRGIGLDQDLFAARTYLNWLIGKLEVHLGYEHENQDFTSENTKMDYVFLRIRRSF